LDAGTAREEAKRLVGLVADNQDPAKERDKAKEVIRVVDLGKKFLAVYISQYSKPRTQDEYRRCVNLFIVPALGKCRLTDTTKADVPSSIMTCMRSRHRLTGHCPTVAVSRRRTEKGHHIAEVALP